MINVIVSNGKPVSLSSGEKIAGVSYLDDKARDEYLRENHIDCLLSADGKVICKSVHAPSPEELDLVANQEIMVGEFKGMKRGDIFGRDLNNPQYSDKAFAIAQKSSV